MPVPGKAHLTHCDAVAIINPDPARCTLEARSVTK